MMAFDVTLLPPGTSFHPSTRCFAHPSPFYQANIIRSGFTKPEPVDNITFTVFCKISPAPHPPHTANGVTFHTSRLEKAATDFFCVKSC